jgi:ribosomal protein S14
MLNVRPQHATYSMNRFARAWKAAVRGYREGVVPDQSAPAEYQSGGHRIRCPQCGGERFLMRPPMMFCWATILTCDRCGLEQRYGKQPERVA